VVKIRMLAVENVFISQPWEGARWQKIGVFESALIISRFQNQISYSVGNIWSTNCKGSTQNSRNLFSATLIMHVLI
jgi:hypothetical protein